MDAEDALQECAVVFVECVQRYIAAENAKVDNPAWFMSLYQTCVTNRFHRLSIQSSRMPATVEYVNQSEGASYNEGPALVALSEMSQEARHVLRKIAEAPAEFLQIALAPVSSLEAWSRRLCRLTGAALNSGVVREVQSALIRGEVSMADEEVKSKTIYEDIYASVRKMNPKFKEQAAKEEDEPYLIRLMKVVSEGTQEEFEALSEDTIAWFDAACEDANAKKAIPLPAGFESAFTGKAGAAAKEKAAPEEKKAKANGAAEPAVADASEKGKKRGRRSSLNPDAVIRLEKDELCNPEAKAYERFKAFRDGMTVQEALTAGIFSADITYLRDTTKRITLEEPASS